MDTVRNSLRNAVTLAASLTALCLLVRCTVQDRDYADLNIGNANGGASSGSAGSAAGNAAGSGGSNAGTGGEGGDGTGGNGGTGGEGGDGTGGAAGGDASDAGPPDAGEDSGTSGGTGGTGDAGGSGGGGGTGQCGAAEVCVPPVPGGWTGPIVVSDTGGATSCPGTYATPLGQVNAGLNAPAANCGCGCFVTGVNCFIGSGNSGGPFVPSGSCDSPPTEDDCLSAQLSTSCAPTGSSSITPLTWATTRLTCGGATANDSCSGGSCFPSGSGFGSVCISQDADVSCPSEFPNRSAFFRDVTDTRSCTACGCFTQGHSCEINIEVCSLGFYEATLSTDLGNEECLNSSDGDGVTQFPPVITGGTCSTTGGVAQGSAQPTNPVTVCCL